jgi:curved DNA-binding protein CbpA
VKKAYRAKALKFHPDRNHGDPTAEAKFKECSRAFEQISRGDGGENVFSDGSSGGFRRAGPNNEDMERMLREIFGKDFEKSFCQGQGSMFREAPGMGPMSGRSSGGFGGYSESRTVMRRNNQTVVIVQRRYPDGRIETREETHEMSEAQKEELRKVSEEMQRAATNMVKTVVGTIAREAAKAAAEHVKGQLQNAASNAVNGVLGFFGFKDNRDDKSKKRMK